MQDFDVQAARAAGYSDAEIAQYLQSTNRNPGKVFFLASKAQRDAALAPMDSTPKEPPQAAAE